MYLVAHRNSILVARTEWVVNPVHSQYVGVAIQKIRIRAARKHLILRILSSSILEIAWYFRQRTLGKRWLIKPLAFKNFEVLIVKWDAQGNIEWN